MTVVAKVYRAGTNENNETLYSLMIDNEEIIRTKNYDKILDVASQYSIEESDFAYNSYLKNTGPRKDHSEQYNKYNYYISHRSKKYYNRVTKPFAIVDQNNNEALNSLNEKNIRAIFKYHCSRFNNDMLEKNIPPQFNSNKNAKFIHDNYCSFILFSRYHSSKKYNDILFIDESSIYYNKFLSSLLYSFYFNSDPIFTFFKDDNPFNIDKDNISKI